MARGGAHFEAVGLDEVERAQEAVEAGEDAQVLLQVVEAVGGEGGGGQSFVNVAVEEEDGLFGVFGGEGECARRRCVRRLRGRFCRKRA